MFVKSLATLKREKLYSALDKGRKRNPNEWDTDTLFIAVEREMKELIADYISYDIKDDPSIHDIHNVMEEIADVSNCLDFLFQSMLEEIELIMKAHSK